MMDRSDQDSSALRDAAIMLEFGVSAKETGVRATMTPITLATIGLPWSEVQRIARELRTGITVEEHEPCHIVLETSDSGPDFCSHGDALTDEETWPHACEDCAADIGADMQAESVGH